MTSRKQISANQRNAKRSTGPRSQVGKRRTRRNAIKHGLTAESILIEGESREDFDSLCRQLYEELNPTSTLEHQYVERFVGYVWRLRRIPVLEAALFEARRLEVQYNDASKDVADCGYDALDIPDLRSYDESDPAYIDGKKRLKNAEKGLRQPRPLLGRAFIRDAQHLDALGKLSRYESRLTRASERTLEQIRKLKEQRVDNDPHESEVIDLHPVGKTD